MIHDLGAAAQGANRQAAADHLAEAGEVGTDAEQLLSATGREPEAGHHLVENKQRFVRGAKFPEGFKKTGRGRNQSRIRRDRFDDDAAISPRFCAKSGAEGFHVIKGSARVRLASAAGMPALSGLAEGERAGTGLDQQGIDMAVITASNLMILSRRVNPRASRMALIVASVPLLVMRTLSSRGHPFADGAGKLDFEAVGMPKLVPAISGFLHGGDHVGLRVAEDRRAPGADVIDVDIAVDVLHAGTAGFLREERRSAHGAKGAHRRVDPARHVAERLREKFLERAEFMIHESYGKRRKKPSMRVTVESELSLEIECVFSGAGLRKLPGPEIADRGGGLGRKL